MDGQKIDLCSGSRLARLFPVSSSRSLRRTPPIKGFNSPRLIETGELEDLVNHPSVRIVDMRTSLPDYLKGHIPNAVYLHFETLRLPRQRCPCQAPDRICLERLLGENLSVSNNMWVILYSEKSNPNATYLAWTLDFLGHRKVGVLNGGWEKWVSENRPTPQEYPSLAPKKFFGKVIREETLAEKKWVRGHLSFKGRGDRRCPAAQAVQRRGGRGDPERAYPGGQESVLGDNPGRKRGQDVEKERGSPETLRRIGDHPGTRRSWSTAAPEERRATSTSP